MCILMCSFTLRLGESRRERGEWGRWMGRQSVIFKKSGTLCGMLALCVGVFSSQDGQSLRDMHRRTRSTEKVMEMLDLPS